MMELFLKGLGMYQVACIPVDVTHKKTVKRCFEGQMKKHLEAYLLDEGMPTDFFFRWERDASLTCQNFRKVLFLRKERGVITHPSYFYSGQFIEMLYWGYNDPFS